MYEYKAKLLKVVDGDTVDLMIDLGFRSFRKERCRLYGMDTPERGQMGYSEAIAELAKLIAWVTVQASEPYICIRSHKPNTVPNQDRWGRWVVEIFDEHDPDYTVNNAMVEAGFAIPFMREA